eukprot:5925122-Ditylum_brightwellii.AAC.1
MSAVQAKQEMPEQEMRNSGIDNEAFILMEPVVVHLDPNDNDVDNDNDDLSSGSEDTALVVGVLPEDVTEAESESQVVCSLKIFPLLTIFRTMSLSFVVTFGTFMAIGEIMIHCFEHSLCTHGMKHKLVKEGYKWFVLADSKTYCILNLMPDGQSDRQKRCGIDETTET